MRYYIADCHFGHEKVRQLDRRPFETVEQMDEYMIERWNHAVRKKKDEVVILGDFCIGKGERVNELLTRLNGRKCLISGNHDKMFLRDKKLDTGLFSWIRPYAELHDNNRRVVLSHYPIMCYNGQYNGDSAYMLYGHVHDTRDYKNIKNFIQETRGTVYGDEGEKIPCNMINCFAVFSDYVPLTLDEWIVRENSRNPFI